MLSSGEIFDTASGVCRVDNTAALIKRIFNQTVKWGPIMNIPIQDQIILYNFYITVN